MGWVLCLWFCGPVGVKEVRHSCGAFRTSPIPALLIEMGEMPLCLRRIKLGMQYWVKLSGSNLAFPGRRLMQWTLDSYRKIRNKTFFEGINQWTRKLRM